MPAASHLASHFRDRLRRGDGRRDAALETLRAVAGPIVWCSATGALGYLALATSRVVPVVRQFGVVLAVCTLAASLLTLAVAPAAMLPPRRRDRAASSGRGSRIAEAMNGLLIWIVAHPLPIVLVSMAIILPMTAGMLRLRYESNYINAFDSESRVVQDYRAIESRIGGIGIVSLVVPTRPPLTMETLAAFRDLERGIIEKTGEDATSGILSLATALDPDGTLQALPAETAERVLAAKLDLIASVPQGEAIRSFWNPEQGWARMMVRVSERREASAKVATFERALAEARSRFGETSYLTGMSYLLTRTTRAMMATSWTTFLWAFGSILLMLVLAYRSVSLAALAIVPSVLAVGLVLGLMGWVGVRLDIATALVASVALGLSVDDTFHCLLQYRRLRRLGVPFRDALFDSYAVSGPGVLLSSLAVASGFAVLWMSEFVPFRNFGLMVGIATLGSSFGNIVFLPSCLALAERIRERGRRAAEVVATRSVEA